MSPRLAFAIDTVTKAGRSTLAHFQTGTGYDIKADASPVTVADREAERLIRAAIAEAYPGEAILGEEEGATGSGPDRWVLDPIDGTKSFICGVPLYSTLLSFEVQGEPVIGVCYFPALDELLFAERGFGAFWNGRPARVSDKTQVSGSVICCGGHLTMHEEGRMDDFIRLSERAMATRTWSDAYGHALVATGRVEAMIDAKVRRWDVSAMKVIIEEAGGVLTGFQGESALYAEDSESLRVLSSNGHIHEELLGAFAS